MSGFSDDLFSLLQMVTMVLRPLLGCVVLAGVLLLFAADRRSYTLCMVIGASIFLLLQLAYIVMWFPNLGLLFRGDPDPGEIQKFFGYTSMVDLVGSILFSYGILMMGIVQMKLSRNPDFRRE